MSRKLNVLLFSGTIDHFPVPPGLCIKTRLSAQPLIWIFLKTEIFSPQFAKKYASKRSIFESFSPVHTN